MRHVVWGAVMVLGSVVGLVGLGDSPRQGSPGVHPCYGPEGERPAWWAEVEGLGEGYGGVHGRVYSLDGDPVGGVQVSIEGTRLGALSNISGQFRIDSVAAGYPVLKVALIGYGTQWHQLSVATERTDTLCLVLRPVWIELAAVGWED